MYIKCHKCASMFELEDEWAHQPDIDFPCPSCSTSMTVRRNRFVNPAAPSPAAPSPSQSPAKSDRTMVMPDLDDAPPPPQPAAPRRPSAPSAPSRPSAPPAQAAAKGDRTMMMPELDDAPSGGGAPPAIGGGEATMMMAPVSDDFLSDTGGHAAEATAFIDTSRKSAPSAPLPPQSKPMNSNASMAFEPTGFMPSMGDEGGNVPQQADKTAFLSTGPSAPAEADRTAFLSTGPSAPAEADRTAFLQAPAPSRAPAHEAEATMFIQDAAPPSRPAAPPRPSVSRAPQEDLHVDQVSGEATMFIDTPASSPSRPSSAPSAGMRSSAPGPAHAPQSTGDVHGDSTQMVTAVDEAALQAFLSKRQNKSEVQQRYAEENRGLRELNPGGGTAVVGAMGDVDPMQGPPPQQGPPPEWGQIPQAPPDKQQGGSKGKPAKGKGAKGGEKKKGGVLKWIIILLILGGLGYGGYYAYLTWF